MQPQAAPIGQCPPHASEQWIEHGKQLIATPPIANSMRRAQRERTMPYSENDQDDNANLDGPVSVVSVEPTEVPASAPAIEVFPLAPLAQVAGETLPLPAPELLPIVPVQHVRVGGRAGVSVRAIEGGEVRVKRVKGDHGHDAAELSLADHMRALLLKIAAWPSAPVEVVDAYDHVSDAVDALDAQAAAAAAK
jgi:hypothetical protein